MDGATESQTLHLFDPGMTLCKCGIAMIVHVHISAFSHKQAKRFTDCSTAGEF